MDSAWFRLLNDACAGGFWLQQKHITKHVLLSGRTWRLETSTEGDEYISDGSESRWCENCFSHVAYEDESGHLRVSFGDCDVSLPESAAIQTPNPQVQ
eukprot:5750226-Amphidinium_carterae.1